MKMNQMTVTTNRNEFSDLALFINADYLISDDTDFNIFKSLPFPKLKVIGLEEFLALISGVGIINTDSGLEGEVSLRVNWFGNWLFSTLPVKRGRPSGAIYLEYRVSLRKTPHKGTRNTPTNWGV